MMYIKARTAPILSTVSRGGTQRGHLETCWLRGTTTTS